MKTVLVVLAALLIVGCAGITTQTPSNNQFDEEGVQPTFTQRFELGIDMPDAVSAKLTPEQLTAIYTALASKEIAPGGTFTYEPHLEFHQQIGNDAQTDAQQDWQADIEATLEGLLE